MAKFATNTLKVKNVAILATLGLLGSCMQRSETSNAAASAGMLLRAPAEKDPASTTSAVVIVICKWRAMRRLLFPREELRTAVYSAAA